MYKLTLHDRADYWQYTEEQVENATDLISRINAIPRDKLDYSQPLAGISVERDERDVMSIGLSSDGFILIHSRYDEGGELDQKISVGPNRVGHVAIHFGEWAEVPAWGRISPELASEVLRHWLDTGETGTEVAFQHM